MFHSCALSLELVYGELLFAPQFLVFAYLATMLRCAISSFFSSMSSPVGRQNSGPIDIVDFPCLGA